jgi:hypothetical protein
MNLSQVEIKKSKGGAEHWWLTPGILAIQEAEIRKIMVWSRPGQKVQETVSQKYPTRKRAGGVTQVVKCLSSKYETLSSNPKNT